MLELYKVIAHLISVFVFYRFMDRMLHRKYSAFFVYLVMVCWYGVITYVNIDLGLYKVFPQLLLFFLNDLGITLLLFGSSKGKKLLTALLIQPGIHSLSAFVFLPFTLYLVQFTENAQMVSLLFQICDVFTFIFSAIIYEIIGKVFKNIRGNIPFHCCVYLFILTAFITQSVVFICENQLEHSWGSWQRMLLSTFCALTGMGLVNFAIYYADKWLALPLAEQRNTLLMEHVISLNHQEKAMASFRHDMKNHFICIGNLLEANCLKEAKLYLGDITKAAEQTNVVVVTGNVYADAVLGEKKSKAEQLGIDMDIDMLCPPESTIPTFELCIILNNALDNALEACQKITTASVPKQILITAYVKQNFLVLNISNTVSYPVQIVDNNIETTKQNKRIHGIGLSNIKAAVLRCKGDFKLFASKDGITISIILPL